MRCIICANGNDLPEGEYCRACGIDYEWKRRIFTMKSTKEMRDRCRELSIPNRDDYDRAVVCILDDFETAQYFKLPDGKIVSFNPTGRWHGWIWRRHPDGQLVSEEKLEAVDPPQFR